MGDNRLSWWTCVRSFTVVVVLILIPGNVSQTLSWWQKTIVYQVYPRSFMDSDGDGIGDIKGIISKLDHFKYLGVDSFWLSPVYKSPMRDFGYDISDYRDIDPIFGTIQDFDNLVKEAHDRGLNIIMDYVPGHTSTDHVWFNKSVNREGNYTDYYVWNDGKVLPNGTLVAPNNWLSVFGGSAWSWNDVRKQYYYHAFLPTQADLNYRDENVQREMMDVVRFWMGKGVDGFRVDAIEKLFEMEDVSLDEPVANPNLPPIQYEHLNHTFTSNLPETIPTVASWFQVMDEFRKRDGKDRYMVIELYAEPSVRNMLYNTGGSPFNFDLIDLSPNPTGFEIRDRVLNEYNNLPSGKWPNFVLGNHDRRRVSYKFGSQYVDVYNMLLLTLWGTPTTYYGEEIGMLEGIISWNETVDPWGRNYGEARYQEFSRDPERTPMQWTGGYQAGFTTGSRTWLPLGQNYTTINVETQKNSAKVSSVQLYAQLAALRKEPVFQTGDFKVLYVDTNVFSYARVGSGLKYLVALNVGKQETTVDFTRNVTESGTATVIALTPGVQGITKGSTVNLASIKLRPGDGLLLQVVKPATTTKPRNSARGLLTLRLSWLFLYLLSVLLCAILHSDFVLI